MAERTSPGWTFLTNHAQVLVCIARDPGVRLRDIGDRVGITERAAHRIVTELADAGYIARERNGRRNRYTINALLPLPDPIAREQNVGELLEILTATQGSERRVDRAGASG
jgi:DNA-binding Lrp family transcriptional regulator